MNTDQNQLQLKASDETLKGVYANVMQVQHSKEEFLLDFMNTFPPVATLNARVIISPGHMKRIVGALKENIERYEAAHGKIEEAAAPDEIGFAAK